MTVGTRGRGGGAIVPPQYFANPQKSKSFKKRHINRCIAIRIKYAHSSVDIGNLRYTIVQNCILLKYKCDKKNVGRLRRANLFCPPPPSPKRPYGLEKMLTVVKHVLQSCVLYSQRLWSAVRRFIPDRKVHPGRSPLFLPPDTKEREIIYAEFRCVDDRKLCVVYSSQHEAIMKTQLTWCSDLLIILNILSIYVKV